jgi:hypothetical protein
MINAMEEKRMMPVEEYLLPMAFARAVDVDSTVAYMGSLMTFLTKGSETGDASPFWSTTPNLAMSLHLTSMSGSMSCTLCWKAQCASTAKTRL